MKKVPDYFEKIKQRTVKRWEQLEHDAELAGPWHQLFAQVQSPRHVFSELLQNADDANAKFVLAYIQEGEFIFEHDGEDFTEEHFSSLCRFGYSNKRNLHTIGFRGVGFKSTFSLGDEVELLTPTLSVIFRKVRFTEPVWNAYQVPVTNTQVKVKIKDPQRQQELEKNLSEWSASPISLLFFRSIQSIEIQGELINRQSLGKGPVENSEWISLSDNQKSPYLLIRSKEEDFPQVATEEIYQERMGSENLELPPCQVDIVIAPDKNSKLYVVLPTGIKTKLPFICNAPFIQDPARVKIKDTETSPTNRWLLERLGRFAAESMLSWLNQTGLGIEERAKAYMCFPDVDRNDNSIEGICGTICEETFEKKIEGQKFLLSEDSIILSQGEAISISSTLYDIWKPEQISKLFDTKQRSLISKNISAENIRKLKNWNLLEEIEDSKVLETLQKCHCPKPETWRQLLLLWNFIFRKTDDYYNRRFRPSYRIVPVQSKDILFSSTEVVRIGEKKLLQRSEDWDFLSEYLIVLNNGWVHFLAKQLLKAKQNDDGSMSEQIENANELLKNCNLSEASDVSRIINSVSTKFYAQEECSLESCIRLAHISAALGVTVSDKFQYVTCDDYRKATDQNIVADTESNLDLFLKEEWYQEHVLHEDYFREYLSCTEAQWLQWITSERSKVLSFVPIQPERQNCWSVHNLKKICEERGINNYSLPYVRENFVIDDWDFAPEHWKYWQQQAQEDKEYWGKLFAKILQMPRRAWASTLSIKISQVATTGNTRSITNEEASPRWILKFRDLPCLQDTHGWYRKPIELFRRTPQTEPLLDVENFVNAEFDTEHNRPLLIKLGLQDKPTGPELLLERLRALAKAPNPPIYEVQKWYNRLDQMIDNCSTENLQLIKNTFTQESIILAEDETWAKSNEIFLQNNEEDVQGTATIHPTVRHLSLWHKIGVAIQPTAELAIDWLKSLESGTKLTPEETRRVGTLLSRYSTTIWNDCSHWLNLDGQWAPTDQLAYKLTMQSLVPWSNLFPSFKQKTADCQKLSIDLCTLPPFSQLTNLADHIEDYIHEGLFDSAFSVEKEWMKILGHGIARMIFNDELEKERIRELGRRLAKTQWQPTTGLEVIPYMDGTPAGSARQTSVAWKDDILFVEDCGVARIFKAVAQELARPFGRPDITDAIKACVDRSAKFINEYLEENFKLLPPEQIEQQAKEAEEKSTPEQPETEALAVTNVTKAGQQEEEAVAGSGENTDEPANVPGSTDVIPAAQDETEQNGSGSGGETPMPIIRTYTPKPSKPRLIELFAKSLGYTIDGQADRFYSYDGSWIQKADGGVFPWERYIASGELEKSYWTKEHCLHHEPLQLDSEIWELCRKNPQSYSLVLIDRVGSPIELSGQKLVELVNEGNLILYPAKYRLVLDLEKTNGIDL